MGDAVEVERLRQRAQRLLAAQRAQVRALLKLRELLGGSLVVRYAVCGKEGCACREGEKHGPYYVLSNRSGGQGGYAYLQEPQVRCARELVQRHRQFRDGMRRLKKTNEELVEAMQRYRTTLSRRGERTLRASARSEDAKSC